MKPELGAAMEYLVGMPILIEAQPALRRGEVAVWDLVDIPLGIRRGLATPRVSEALEPFFFMEGIQQHHQKWTGRGYYAAVAWADLQPLIIKEGPPVHALAAAYGATLLQPVGPRLVDAEPERKVGDVAVWDVVDIPVGVQRQDAVVSVEMAIERRSRLQFGAYDPVPCTRGTWFAIVRWADLQSLRPVPRGRDTMTTRQWGDDRDEHGFCTVCRADDSMWCDTMVHKDIEAARSLAASGVPSPRDRPQPARTTENIIDAEAITVALMGAGSGEDFDRSGLSDEDRAVWAKALRERVLAGEQHERGKIKVDLEFEEWE